jgi:STAS domain
MAPLLQSATTPSDGQAVVTVRGDIDSDTAAQLWQYLSYLLGQGHHHIALDLRGMVLIDSAGSRSLPGYRPGRAARVASWCCGRSARPWPSSWSWPAAPRPTGATPQQPATNRVVHRRKVRRTM